MAGIQTVPRKKMAWEYNNNKLGKPLTYFVLGRANGHLKVPKITFAKPSSTEHTAACQVPNAFNMCIRHV
jgi:hypothetical protein